MGRLGRACGGRSRQGGGRAARKAIGACSVSTLPRRPWPALSPYIPHDRHPPPCAAESRRCSSPAACFWPPARPRTESPLPGPASQTPRPASAWGQRLHGCACSEARDVGRWGCETVGWQSRGGRRRQAGGGRRRRGHLHAAAAPHRRPQTRCRCQMRDMVPNAFCC